VLRHRTIQTRGRPLWVADKRAIADAIMDRAEELDVDLIVLGGAPPGLGGPGKGGCGRGFSSSKGNAPGMNRTCARGLGNAVQSVEPAYFERIRKKGRVRYALSI
jgi:hypothetical protein